MDTNYSLSDIAAITGNNGNNRSNDGFGDGNGWWIILFFICMFCGWGNGNGWGNNGGAGSTNGTTWVNGLATRSDIADGFALNNIQSGITGIQQGICDATYALNNTINSGFHNQTIATMQGFNQMQSDMCGLSSQLAQCCCDERAAIADLKYTIANENCQTRQTIQNNTRDIIESQNAGTRAILDFLTQDKISSLQTELAQAQGQLSQANQTNSIINALKQPCPIPAYNVPNPYAYCGGCGCNC